MMIQGNSDSIENKPFEDTESTLDVEASGVTEKEPGAFLTISEVADEIHVPQHVLRFWETRFTQLQPIKRSGGRRYYRAEDVALLKYVAELLYVQGYTIKGVQRLLKEDLSRFSASQDGVEKHKGENDKADPSQEDVALIEAQSIMEDNLMDQELKNLKSENGFLVDSLESILSELEELRKIIAEG